MTTKTLQEQIIEQPLPVPAGVADFHVSAVFDCRIGESCYTEHQVRAILKATADLAAGQQPATISESSRKAALEIADQFDIGFFDRRMVDHVASIIEKHCAASQQTKQSFDKFEELSHQAAEPVAEGWFLKTCWHDGSSSWVQVRKGVDGAVQLFSIAPGIQQQQCLCATLGHSETVERIKVLIHGIDLKEYPGTTRKYLVDWLAKEQERAALAKGGAA